MHERQAHAAHQTFQKSAAAALAAAGDGPGFREGRFCHNGSHAGREIGTVPLSAAPPQTVDANSPEVVAQLESLDDAVFDAIRGKAAALAELRLLWPESEIPPGRRHLGRIARTVCPLRALRMARAGRH